METKYTPGPWLIEPGEAPDRSVGIMHGTPPSIYAETPDGHSVTICTVHEAAYVEDKGNHPFVDGQNTGDNCFECGQHRTAEIHEFDSGDRYYGDGSKNLMLIGAAPEMLELLQEITGTECLGHWSDLQKRVLAVIEKTGNTA